MEMQSYTVLVPKPGTRAAAIIDAGSGVVTEGWIDTEGRIEVYFEGNRHGAENLRTYAQRVGSAAGRLVQRYPTIAKATCPSEDFHVVGKYLFAPDWSTFALKLTDEATALDWCGAPWVEKASQSPARRLAPSDSGDAERGAVVPAVWNAGCGPTVDPRLGGSVGDHRDGAVPMKLGPGLTFSWKRAVGLTQLRTAIARQTGIPTTRGGIERKVGRVLMQSVWALVRGAVK